MDIDEEIKDKLGTKVWKKVTDEGGGCISKGVSYEIDGNQMIFVKRNNGDLARLMFDGEFESLKALKATKTVRTPKPLVVVDDPQGEGAAFAMEYLVMNRLSKHSALLGDLLAEMHLHNFRLGKRKQKAESWVGRKERNKEKSDESSDSEYNLEFIDKFGFHVTTCCGYIPLNNQWHEDWWAFFARNRLESILNRLEEEHADRETRELWSHLQLKIPQFFNDLQDPIVPALLHGDLWSGNVAQVIDGPVVFDPASFYGHSEFELSISSLFGGFNRDFYEAYYKKIKKTRDSDKRNELYQLFHYLNHWAHFGGGYKRQSLNLMRRLVKMQFEQ